ncbi:MAG: hypothetical protein HGA45_34115, partial [Chloroflexales bacterium]|nr:hypothetical protein [Chloroflexales bacterium]
MPAATLEIAISQTSGGGVAASARFAADESAAGPAVLAAPAPVALDRAALLAAEGDPEAYGRLLSAQLFSSPGLRQAWARARAAQERDGSPLRVRIGLDQVLDELHALRWETLRDPDADGPLALDERVTLAALIARAR